MSCDKTGTNQENVIRVPQNCFSSEVSWPQNHYSFWSLGVMGPSVYVCISLIDLHMNWIILQQKCWASFVCLWVKGIVMVKCPSSSCSVLVIYYESCWVFTPPPLRREEKLMAELHNEFLLACSSKHTFLQTPSCVSWEEHLQIKDFTSSHRREYTQMGSYRIHTFFCVLSLRVRMATLTTSYRNVTLMWHWSTWYLH